MIPNGLPCRVCDIAFLHPRHLKKMRADNVVGSFGTRGGVVTDITPFRQWCRENLPASSEGMSFAADDGMLITYTSTSLTSTWVTPIEVKAMGADLDYPTNGAFTALTAGRMKPPIIIRLMGGNVPTELRHYPTRCPGCLYPALDSVASSVVVKPWGSTSEEMPGAHLARWLLEHTNYRFTD
jgi:hypothetical protein